MRNKLQKESFKNFVSLRNYLTILDLTFPFIIDVLHMVSHYLPQFHKIYNQVTAFSHVKAAQFLYETKRVSLETLLNRMKRQNILPAEAEFPRFEGKN
jgi:hypothetical protein